MNFVESGVAPLTASELARLPRSNIASRNWSNPFLFNLVSKPIREPRISQAASKPLNLTQGAGSPGIRDEKNVNASVL